MRSPVRSLARSDRAGFTDLRSSQDAHIAQISPGSDILSILQGASDLSSLSDELRGAAHDWQTAFALSPTRANIVRPLDLGRQMSVLQINCGAGAVGRYLGEECGSVDLIDVSPERASEAAARTRDLDNTRVFCGTIDDIPEQPAYDLIVAITAHMGDDDFPATELELTSLIVRMTSRLADGGTLLLGLPNPLGVKYLAGAANDVTGRPFDGVEGFPFEPHRSATTRVRLESLLTEGGLRPTTYGAFPDHMMPRVVMAPDVFKAAPALATNLPNFPSRDYGVGALDTGDEARIWNTLNEMGVAREFCNSWVVLATKGNGPNLWPHGLYARMYNADRVTRFMSHLSVQKSAGRGLYIHRKQILRSAEGDTPCVQGVRWLGGDESIVTGEALDDLLWAGEDRTPLLRDWADLVPETSHMPVDLVPWNIIKSGDKLVAIDQEWTVETYRRSSVIARGIVFTVSRQAAHARWLNTDGNKSVLTMAREWAADAGLPLDDEVIDHFVEDESHFQEAACGSDRLKTQQELQALFELPVSQLQGRIRVDFELEQLQQSLHEAVSAVRILEHRNEAYEKRPFRTALRRNRVTQALMRTGMGAQVRRWRARRSAEAS